MTEYEQTNNGETLQEGYCEEDYQETLANDPGYQSWSDKNEMTIPLLDKMMDKINATVKGAPF